MHTYIDIFMGVFVIALGLGLVQAARLSTQQDQRIARLEQENDCLADSNAALFLAFVEDAGKMRELRVENDTMWDFIRRAPLVPAPAVVFNDDEPIPFVPSDQLQKLWDDEAQPYLFEDESFKDNTHAQAVDLVTEKLGGQVLEFHSTPDCEQ